MLIGYKRKKIPGLLAACLGMVCPSVIIILIVAMFIKNILQYEAVMNAFNGIRVAVAALIVKTTFDMGKKSVVDMACAVIFLVSLAVFAFTKISPIIPVFAGGAAGIALKSIKAGS
jgi:chromate transporter